MSACTSISSERAPRKGGGPARGARRQGGPGPASAARAILMVFATVLVPLAMELHGAVGCVPSDACLRHSDCDTGLSCIDGTCQAPPPEADGGAIDLDASADGGDAGDGATDGGDAGSDASTDGGDAGPDAGDAGADGGVDGGAGGNDAGQGGAGGGGGTTTTTTTTTTTGAGGMGGAGGTGGAAGFIFP